MRPRVFLRQALCASVIVFLLSLISHQAEARRFDFKSEKFATYFRGSYGYSNVGRSPYGFSSGADVSVDKTITSNLSGEFGLLFSGQKVNFRVGAEILMPSEYSDIKGRGSSGDELFQLNSKVIAFVPMGNLEFLAYQTPVSRVLFGLGGGMALVALSNTYTMSSAGAAALGISDHSEKAKAEVFAWQTYLGYEHHFTDTVTAVFDLGYRHIPVKELKSTKTTTALSGGQTEGQKIVNMDGGNRSIDLGGVFAGLAFRFYIGL